MRIFTFVVDISRDADVDEAEQVVDRLLRNLFALRFEHVGQISCWNETRIGPVFERFESSSFISSKVTTKLFLRFKNGLQNN
jgi:hypothetical protein